MRRWVAGGCLRFGGRCEGLFVKLISGGLAWSCNEV